MHKYNFCSRLFSRKCNPNKIFLLAAAALAVGLPVESKATSYYWDVNGRYANGSGGSGNWSDGNWAYSSGGRSQTYAVTFNSNDAANFDGTAGTVSVNSGTVVRTINDAVGMTFSGGSLGFSGGANPINVTAPVTTTINLNPTFNSSGTINVSSGGELNISGNITAPSYITLTKSGGGNLTLGGSNSSFSGTLSLTDGNLKLTNSSALSSATLSIGAGALTFDQSVTSNAFTLGGLEGSVDIALQNNAGNAIALSIGGNHNYSGILSGAGRLVVRSGWVTLYGQNTFTGGITLNDGVVNVTDLDNGGVAGNIGAASSDAANLVLNGGTLRYIGAGTSTDRNFTIGSSGGIIDASGSGAINIFGKATITSPGSRTFRLSGSNGGDNTLGSILSDSSAGGATSLTKIDGGQWVLTELNDYTGVTTIGGGTLVVSQINNGGVAGNIGAASSSASNIVFNSGTLKYVGAGETTDRGFSMTGNGGRIDSSGSGALILDGQFSTPSNGNFFLGGTNTDLNTLNTVVSGWTNLFKQDSGTWVLTKANTFTGYMVISGGELRLNNQFALQNSAVVLQGGRLIFDQSVSANAFTFGSLGGDSSANISLTNNAGTPAPIVLTVGGNHYSTTYSGVLSGDGRLVKVGQGDLILSGLNTYTGSTTINEGRLRVYSINNGGTSGGLGAATDDATNLVINGGTLSYIGGTNSSTDRNFTIGLDGAGFESSGASIDFIRAPTFSGTGARTITLSGWSQGLNAMSGVISDSAGGGVTSVNKIEGGQWMLRGINDYTGVTTVYDGTLTVAVMNNGGVAGNLGATSNAVSNIVLDSGTLKYIGGGETTDRGFSITSQGGTINASGGKIVFSGSGADGGFAVTGNGMLTLRGWSAADNTLNVLINDGASLTKDDGGRWVLTAENTYSGSTSINSGILSISAVADRGLASNLGTGTGNIGYLGDVLINGAIGGNIYINGGTLEFTGSNASKATTNRGLSIGNSYFAATIDASGSTPFVMTGENAAFGYGYRWLVLTGTNMDDNTIGGALHDSYDSGDGTFYGGQLGVIKRGIGRWKLSGINFYNWDTKLEAGTLVFGNRYAGQNSTLVMLGGNLIFDSSVASNKFMIGGLSAAQSGQGYDITLENNGTAPAAVTLSIGNNGYNTTYAGILSGMGGIEKIGFGDLKLTAANTFAGDTTVTDGILNLANTLALQNSTVTTNGGQISFSGGAYTFGGLASTGSGFGYDIVLEKDVPYNWNGGRPSNLVGHAPPVALTVGGNNADTVYAAILSGDGSLTKVGTGSLTLSGANTYTGSTRINGGSLVLGNVRALQNSTVVMGGGSLIFDSSVSEGNYVINGLSAPTSGLGYDILLETNALIPSPINLIIDTTGASPSTYAGVMSGTGGINKNGAGTLTLSGASIYTGVTEIGGNGESVLSVSQINNGGVAGNIGAASFDATKIYFSGGTLLYTGAGETTNRGFSLGWNNTSTINASGSGALVFGGNGINGGFAAPGIIADDRTLTLRGTNTNLNTLGLTIVDHALGKTNLIKDDVGKWVLTEANTFTGGTTIYGGELRLKNPFALQNSTVTMAGSAVKGGTLIFDQSGGGGWGWDPYSVSFTLGALASSSSGLGFDISLQDNASAPIPVELRVGRNDATTTYAGVLSGSGDLVKFGGGIMTLTGMSTYTGMTVIVGGKLSVSTINDGGVNGNLGAATSAAENLTFDGGTLLYTGATASTNRNFAISFLGGTIEAGGTGAITFFGSPEIWTSSSTLTLSGANTEDNTMAGAISESGVYGSHDTRLTKIDGGKWVLAGLNSYEGTTTINGGILSVSFINNYGQAGNLGLGFGTSARSEALVINGGTLLYTGTGETSDRGFSVGSNSGIVDASGSGALTFSGDILAPDATGNRTLTLTGTNTGGNELAGNIKNHATSGVTSVTKTGTGTWALSGSSTYTGVTTINSGKLSISSVADGGSVSNIGAASAAASNLVINGGTLQFTGLSNGTTDRGFTIGTSGATIDASGSTSFKITGDVEYDGYGSRTLELTGTSLNDNEIGGSLSDPGYGVLTLTKSGVGKWILSASNTYTGVTNIDQGSLQLGDTWAAQNSTVVMNGGDLLFDSKVSTNNFTIGGLSAVTSGAGYDIVLQNNANTPATVTLSIGNNHWNTTYAGILSGDGAIAKIGYGTLTLSGANTFTGGATASQGTLNLANTLALQNSTVTLDGGYVAFDGSVGSGEFTFGGLAASRSGGNYDLLLQNTYNAAVALTVGTNNEDTNYAGILWGSGSLTKAGTGGLTLSHDNYYTGVTNVNDGSLILANTWAVQNSTVVMNGGNLRFDSSVGSNNFIIGGLSASTSGPGYNIDLSNTLGAAVTLSIGNNQYNTTYAGALSGIGGIEKIGWGTFTLSNANTFVGDTAVSQGELKLADTLALQSSTVRMNGGGIAFDSSVVSGEFTFGGLTSSGAGWGYGIWLQNSANAAVALTVGANSADTNYAGILWGAGSLTKVGKGSLTLSGENIFTGATNVNSGSLVLGTTWAVHNSTVVMNGGNLHFDSSTGSYNFVIGGLTSSSSGAGYNIDLSNTSGAAVTLYIGYNGASSSYAGVLSGTGGIEKIGSGALTLTNANTFTGNATLTGGTLKLDNALALQNSTVTMNGGAVVFDSSVASNEFTFGGLAASYSGWGYDITLQNNANAAVALNVGANNTNSNYAGVLSGAGSLTKVGTGSLTLSGANTYTGVTNVNNGSLILGATLAAQNSTVVMNGGDLRFDSSVGSRYFTIGGLSASTSGAGFDIDLQNTSGQAVTLSTGNNGTSTTYAGVLSGIGGIEKIGSGTLTLTNANTFTGDAVVTGGIVKLDNASALQNSTVTMNGGAIAFDRSVVSNEFTIGGLASSTSGVGYDIALQNNSGAAIKLKVGNNTTNSTYAGVLSGNGAIEKIGSGILTLSNENTFAGDATVSVGTLNLANTFALKNSAVIMNGGVLAFDSSVGSREFTINSLSASQSGAGYDVALENTAGAAIALTIGVNNADNTYAGVLSGTGSLTKAGTGILTLSGANTFTGATNINNGSLVLQSTLALQNSTVTMNGGAIAFNSSLAVGTEAFTIGGLASSTSGLGYDIALELSDPQYAGYSGCGPGGYINLIIGNNNTDTSYAGVLSGQGSIEKVGSGELMLSGANSYTGTTTVSAGTLTAASGSLAGTSDIVVNGGTFNAVDYNFSANLTLNGSGKATISGTDLTVGTIINNNAATSSLNFSSSTGTITVTSLSGAGSTHFSSNAFMTNGIADGTVDVVGELNSNITGGIITTGSLISSSISGGTTTVSGISTVTTISDGTVYFNGDATVDILNGGEVAVGLGATVTVKNGNNFGKISGLGSLATISDLTLSNLNTFTGGTSVSAGTLNLSHDSALLNSTITMNGGVLTFDSSVSPATFAIGGLASSSAGAGYDIALQNNASTPEAIVLIVGNNNTDTVYAGVLSGIGAFAKIGSGNLTLTGANTYTGATGVFDGILTAAAGSLASTSGITVHGGILNAVDYNFSANLTLNGAGKATISGTDLTVGALINHNTTTNSLDFTATTGTITVTSLSGGGSTHFSSNATMSNGIADGTVDVVGKLNSTITGGTVTAGSLVSSSISGSATTVTVSGIATVDTLSSGTVNFNGDASVAHLNGGTVAIGLGATLTATQYSNMGGVISGDGSFMAGDIILSGANTYTGTTTASGGEFTALAGSLAKTSSIIVNDGSALYAVDYNSSASLTVNTNGWAEISGTDLTVGALSNANTATNSLNFSGNTGTITAASLAGVGSTHFSSNATITNGITDGTVDVVGELNSAISGGTVTAGSLVSSSISGSATTVTVSGIATVDTLSSGTVNFNGNTSVAVLNGGTVAIGSGATFTVANGTSYDVISGQGSLTVTGEVVLRGSFDNAGSYAETGTYSGTTTVSGGSLTAYSLANTSGIIVNGNGGSLRVRSYNSTASLTLEASGYANIYGTNLTVGALSNANTAANSLDFEQDWGTITATSLSGVGSTHFASNATITNGIADGTVTVDGLLTSDISGGTITAASLISSSISGSATTVTVSGIATVDTLSSGTVNFNGDTSVSTLNGGTVAIGSGATLTVVNGTSGDAISGQGSLRITGNVALSGANNYTGTTTVSGGMLTTSAGSLAGTSSIAVNSATLNAVDYNQSASLTLDAFGWATISGTDLTVGALTNANGTAPATLNFSGSTGTINAASLAGIGSTRFGSNATIAGGIAEGTVVVVGELNSVISGGIVTTGALSASSMVTGGVVTIMNESNSTANGLIFAGGTVRAGANNVTGTGSLSINAPTRITSDSNASRTFSSAVTLNSNVTLGSSVEGQGGSLTFQGDVNLGGVGIVVTTDSAVTISGAISNGSIVKSGDATLTLTGANTYTGVTIVSAGTLEAAAGSLATTSAIVVNGGTLNAVDYNSTASLAVGSAGTANISGADLTLGSLSNSNTTPGGLNFTSSTGTITIGDLSGVGSTHFSSNAIILGGIKEGVVDVAGNLEANISGGIVTTYTLTSSCIITGGDVTILKESTDNTALTFAGGIIRAGENNVTAQADLTINALTTITSDSNATRIFNSAIALNSDIALGSAVDGQGGTLIFQGNLDLGGNARTVTTDSAVIMSGTISDGSLVKTGSSTLTLSGNNNYTGATTVSAGTLITSGDNIISSTSGVTIDNGAILQLGGSETINAINNNGTIELGKGASLSTGNDNASTTLGGALAGTGTIVKNGTGELIVANTNNNFGGTVTIAGGILSAVGTNALGNSTINVESGATFAANATLDNNVIVKDGGLLKGSGSMGAVTLNSGGTLAPGNSPGLQTHSSLTINGGASILWQVCDFNSLVRGVDYDSIAVTGKLDLSNASSTNKITVNVMSLANIADSTPGNALNFDYVLPYQFVFATYDTLELGTNTNFGSLFRIDVSAFLDAGGKPMLSDYWRMSYRDHAIYLSYASVLGPGNIPDQMTVGDFTLTGTGTLEVAGLPYNGGHYNDVVKFSGLATLDSSTTLTIARYGAVSPLYGYRYVLFEGTGTPANPNLVSSYFTGTPAPTTVNTSDLNGRYLIAAPAAVNGTISAYDGLIHNADGLVHAPNEYAVYFVRDAAGYNLPGIDSSLVSFVQKITMAGPGGPLESGGTVYIPGETTPALSPLGARLMIMTDPQLQFAMNNLTPNFYGVIPSIIATGQRSDFQTLSGELGQYHHERDEANSSFSQGFVRVKSSTSKGGTGSDSVPFDTSASGVMAGYVKGMSASSVAGFTISNDDSKGTQQSNSLKGNTFSGTAFVSSATNSSVGTMYFDAGVSAGYSSSKSTRTSFIGPETATPKAQSYGAFARVGLKQDNASGFGFSPYLGMDYVRVNGDAFSESGDDASMSVAAYHYDSSRLTVGANVSWVDADTTSPFKFDLAFEAFSEIGGGKSVDLTSGFGSAGSFTSRAAVSSGGGYRIAPSFVYQDSAESSYYLNFSVERSGASSIKGAELGYRRRF